MVTYTTPWSAMEERRKKERKKVKSLDRDWESVLVSPDTHILYEAFDQLQVIHVWQCTEEEGAVKSEV